MCVAEAQCLALYKMGSLCACVFPADSGTSGEGRGLRADAEARESPQLPPGAAAAENPGSAERHANR